MAGLRWKLASCVLAAVAALAAHALRPAAQDAAPGAARGPVTVLVLRHAEKDASDPGDANPGLSEAGRARAEALARLLGEARVTHLYASEYRRTQETVAPLAERVGREVEVVSARGPAQVEALRALPPGSVAVVAGHSNTVPALVRALGGGELEGLVPSAYGPILAEESYDRLFLVVLARGGEPGAALELRYGD